MAIRVPSRTRQGLYGYVKLLPVSCPVLLSPDDADVISADSVTVSWLASPGASSYQVYVSTNGGESALSGSTQETEYTITGLSAGNSYEWSVVPISRVGVATACGGRSFSITVPDCPELSSPADEFDLVDETSLELTWEPVGEATGYKVYLSEDGAPEELLATTSDFSYIAEGLLDGSNYSWRIVATNTVGDSSGCSSRTFSVSQSIEAQLSGLSWRLPCIGAPQGVFCVCAASVVDTVVLQAEPGTSYNVTFRVRGVIELIPYTGGTQLTPSFFYKNKTGQNEPAVNIYRLSTSSPAVDYYINNGVFALDLTAIDYEITIPINAGATVTLFADSKDSGEVNNDSPPTSVSDNDPTRPIVVTQPYNGQFAQIDVLSVVQI